MPDFAPPPPRRFRPALVEALRGYSLRMFASDATAGLVVAAVAVPLALAFAIASLAPDPQGAATAPQAAFTTVIVAGSIAALLGGSRFLVTGPTGAFIVVLARIVQDHGIDGLLLATFMAGAMLALAGV